MIFSVKNLAPKHSVISVSSRSHTFNAPELVVDGIHDRNSNGVYNSECMWNIFISAYDQPEQWLRIDFGGWKHAMFVEIHNGVNSYWTTHISNSQIYVYGETPTENRQLCAKIVDGNHEVFYLPCVKTLYGKGIELYYPPIEGSAGRTMAICEIIVLGY